MKMNVLFLFKLVRNNIFFILKIRYTFLIP